MFIHKRILIALGILAIILLGGLGFTTFLLLTQSNANASSASAASTPTVLATTSPSTTNRVCASGIISSINAQGQTFVVTEKGTKTVTITADAQTTYRKRGASGITFSSLSVGQHVRITAQGACDPGSVSFTAKTITIIVSNAPASTPTAARTPTP